LLAVYGGSAVLAVVLDIAEGRVSGVREVANPDKLSAVNAALSARRAPKSSTAGQEDYKDKSGHQRTEGVLRCPFNQHYMLLTTFRRDGRPVAAPLLVVAEADRDFFRTWDASGKAKRLRHTPTVEVAPCSYRGRIKCPAVPAKVTLLDGEASEYAARVLAHKHPVLHGRLIPWYHRRRGWTTQQYLVEPP
jgi:PPOX class probable F420-dependent enzyme